MSSSKRKAALGRGLEAILRSPETDITSKDISGNYVVGAIAEIELYKISTNPFQPRENFEDESLAELAESIKNQGIIQPLTVRKMGFDKYQLISGERRYRAAKMAGLETVPCFIRVANDEQMLEWALIENIQRENLNAIEIAISYNRLIEEVNITQEELSKRVGKKRATVTNYLRLLKLPAEVQAAIINDDISMGHARTLITIEDQKQQLEILNEILKKQLSVRETENLVKNLKEGKSERSEKKTKQQANKLYSDMEDKLQKHFMRKIKFSAKSKGGGTISIPFTSDEDLKKLLKALGIEEK